jgi:hypothetical protein
MKNVPLFLILGIYLPGSIFGLYLFRDQEALDFLLLLVLFLLIYVSSYGFLSRLSGRASRLFFQGFKIPSYFWYVLAGLAVSVYLLSIVYAVFIADAIPLFVALQGGSLIDIAQARSQFLAGLSGYESLVRYFVFILGRSVMPLVLVASFFYAAKFRYLLFGSLIFLSMLSMEKAGPIFVILPLVFYFLFVGKWKSFLVLLGVMVLSVSAISFLALGGNSDTGFRGGEQVDELVVSQEVPIKEAQGDSLRFSLYDFYRKKTTGVLEYYSIENRLVYVLNRIVWIPYVTAYDWLRVQREVLEGRLTMGRSVSFIHLLYGEPKMHLEKMVYVYQFGPSPGGEGAANTVFFVDAKLAFGWVGVVVYCLLFTFFAAVIFSSRNPVLMISSLTCFVVASVSSLTATLLSGGLFIYLILAMILRENGQDVSSREALSAQAK